MERVRIVIPSTAIDDDDDDTDAVGMDIVAGAADAASMGERDTKEDVELDGSDRASNEAEYDNLERGVLIDRELEVEVEGEGV